MVLTLLLIVGLVIGALAYLTSFGVVYIRVLRARESKCDECSHGRYCFNREAHIIPAAVMGLFWPVLVWAVLPAVLADPNRSKIKAAQQAKRIAELEREVGIR